MGTEKELMDIYSSKGTKVIFSGENGHDYELEEAKNFMSIGDILTVDYTEVGGFHTDVIFQEYPNKRFNSVMFEQADMLKKDEKKYNLPVGGCL